MKNGNLDFIYTFDELSRLTEAVNTVDKTDLVSAINTITANATGLDLDAVMDALTPAQAEELTNSITDNTKGSLNMFELADGANADTVVYDVLSNCAYSDGEPIIGDEETYFDDIDGGYDATMYSFLSSLPVQEAKLDSEDNVILVLEVMSKDVEDLLRRDYDGIDR